MHGQALIYSRSGKTWSQQATLTGPDIELDDFAHSISMSGNSVAVGAPWQFMKRGMVYVFVGSGTNWTQQAALAPSDAGYGTQFGQTVSLNGDTLLVGAPGSSVAYVYVRSGSAWTEQATISAPKDTQFDFGNSIASDAGTFLIGMPGISYYPPVTGVVYAYAPPPPLPEITAGGISNGASFQPVVAPGSLATIFGHNFAGKDTPAASVPLTMSLSGVSVSVNGEASPLVFAGSGQVNFQIPYDIAPGPASAVVTVNGTASAAASFNVVATAPGIFVYGNNRAIVQNQDYSLNDATHAAQSGSYVTIYATGLGRLDNPIPAGSPAPDSPLSKALAMPSVTIGGTAATVVFAGMTPGFVGLAQVNVQVPSLAAGAYPVVIVQGGQSSNNPVMNVTQ